MSSEREEEQKTSVAVCVCMCVIFNTLHLQYTESHTHSSILCLSVVCQLEFGSTVQVLTDKQNNSDSPLKFCWLLTEIRDTCTGSTLFFLGTFGCMHGLPNRMSRQGWHPTVACLLFPRFSGLFFSWAICGHTWSLHSTDGFMCKCWLTNFSVNTCPRPALGMNYKGGSSLH